MKHHNNLEDSQIHNPKGFKPARKRTISTKNATGNVDWVKAGYTSTHSVVCLADINNSLHLRYFSLYSSEDAVRYAVYFKIVSAEAMAIPSGFGGVIEIDLTSIGTGATDIQVADALQSTLDAHASFTAVDDNSGVVTVTGVPNLTTTTPVEDVDSGFSFITTDLEVVNEILVTDGSGNFKFTPANAYIAAASSAESDKNYVHTQNTTSSTWVVTHNLNKFPSVSVVDSAGTKVIGQVDYDSLNQITLTFKASFSGKAYFN